jgi:NAD(P)-dependent dehydrogenase (short-subunit alcohol dehydrogenase family)
LATALRLATRGDRLMLASRNERALGRAAERCREAGAAEVRSTVVDVLDRDQIEAAVQATLDAFGGLDAVVHSATVMAYGRLEDLPAEVFTTVVDTAVHGTFHIGRAALAAFRGHGGGTLVVVNSLLGSVTVPNMGAYSAAKWAQRAVVRTLQQETRAEPGIDVCMLSPGSINTPIYDLSANYVGRRTRPPVPVVQPEHAAASIESLLHRPRNNVSIPVGPGNPVIITGFRLMPWLYDRLVGPLFRLAALTGDRTPARAGNVLAPSPAGEAVHGRWPARRSDDA